MESFIKGYTEKAMYNKVSSAMERATDYLMTEKGMDKAHAQAIASIAISASEVDTQNRSFWHFVKMV